MEGARSVIHLRFRSTRSEDDDDGSKEALSDVRWEDQYGFISITNLALRKSRRRLRRAAERVSHQPLSPGFIGQCWHRRSFIRICIFWQCIVDALLDPRPGPQGAQRRRGSSSLCDLSGLYPLHVHVVLLGCCSGIIDTFHADWLLGCKLLAYGGVRCVDLRVAAFRFGRHCIHDDAIWLRLSSSLSCSSFCIYMGSVYVPWSARRPKARSFQRSLSDWHDLECFVAR